jgi:DNA-binding MarR family transcriptional regulator
VCDEDKAAISRSIEYLIQEGFVVRSEEKKRYRAVLTLTEKGESAATSIVKKIDGVLEEAGAGLSESDRIVFYKTLTLISENLQKICDEYE